MSTPTKSQRSPLSRLLRAVMLLLLVGLASLAVGYWFWTPGLDLRDGSHDLGTNGIWLQHGWLGHDDWFRENRRDTTRFRDEQRVAELAALLRQHHIRDVFPHLCPCDPTGHIARWDDQQVERFLDGFKGFRVMPWIGGVLERQAHPDDPAWRTAFCHSVRELLDRHPRLAGVQVNIEPLPTGHAGFLTLLDELKQALPEGKVLSVAAYPPPTRWHPYADVHWDEEYFIGVSQRADQMVVMMYDTALTRPKLYQSLMRAWTEEVLAWSASKPVLLGVPAYDDAGSGYHDPEVENLTNALLGIHSALASLRASSSDRALPSAYQGIAVYSEWEMTENDWLLLRERFLRTVP